MPIAPFRLDLTAMALQRRLVNQMDVWDGETYSRVIAQGEHSVLVEVRQLGTHSSPRLMITATSESHAIISKSYINEALSKLLGLRVDLSKFYRFAGADTRLEPLMRRYLGLKPPRFPSIFEAIVNGIACQQLTLHVGLTLLNRLCARSALSIDTPAGLRYCFPRSEDLRILPTRSFRTLGFSTSKAIAIKSITSEIHERTFNPEELQDYDNEHAAQRLLALRGVGRWTAEYVLLRGLGRTDLFPSDDIGARNNLRRWLRLKHKLDYLAVQRTLARWRPYAGLLYFHLLLDGLESVGQLNSGSQNLSLQRAVPG